MTVTHHVQAIVLFANGNVIRFTKKYSSLYNNSNDKALTIRNQLLIDVFIIVEGFDKPEV